MKQQTPKILVYDIETTLLLPWAFSLGKTVLRHGQLVGGYYNRTHVICITYVWEHEGKVRVLDWGQNANDEMKMLAAFNEIVKKADVVIGKNSSRFDNKHIQTQNFWFGLNKTYEWLNRTDDVETQMRRVLALPSYSLDYISAELGLGGKRKMELGDWKAIGAYRLLQCIPKTSEEICQFFFRASKKQIIADGKKAFKKMITYGKKDAADTLVLYQAVKPYAKQRLNASTILKEACCNNCYGTNIYKNGTKAWGQSIKQMWQCKDCNSFACYTLKESIRSGARL